MLTYYQNLSCGIHRREFSQEVLMNFWGMCADITFENTSVSARDKGVKLYDGFINPTLANSTYLC